MSFILDAIKKSEKERRMSKQNDIQSFQDDSNKKHKHEKKYIFFKLIFFSLILFLIFYFSSEIKFFYDRASSIYQENTIKFEEKNKVESLNSVTEDKKSKNNILYKVTDSLPPKNEIRELWEMPLSFQDNIPNLNFELHIYSEDLSERTIIINDRRMKEGQLISAGLTLKEITQTGVILHKDGIFFHINIIESW